MDLKRWLFLIVFLLLIYLFFFNVKFVGFVLNVPSSVTISQQENEYCGDDICNGAETCSTCDEDCGTCSSSSSSSSSGGGGGGGTIGGRNVTIPNATVASFLYVSPGFISIDVEKGNSYLQQVTLYNTGKEDLSIYVTSSSSILSFVNLQEKNFVLKKGESKVYSFHIYSSARSKANLYSGKLIFKSGNVEASVDVAIGIQELPALFDMKVVSTKEYVLPGRVASAEIKISNIGDSDSVSAVLEYGIMDFNNVIYSSRTENITATRAILTKKVSLKLPDDIAIGRYLFYAKVTYEDKIVVSSDSFQVERLSVIMWAISVGMIVILIILVSLGIVLLNQRRREEIFKKELASKEQLNLKPKEEKIEDLAKDLFNELKKSKSK